MKLFICAICIKTVTLRKHVAESEQMRKLIVWFLIKFQGRDIKIVRVKSIRFSEPLNFFNILLALFSASDVTMSHRFLWDQLAHTLLSLYTLTLTASKSLQDPKYINYKH